MRRKAFAALCEQKGFTFKFMPWDPDTLHVDPPSGHVFADTGLHYISHWMKGWKREDAYAHVADDMAGGTEPCTTDDCDYCAEPEDIS